MWVRLTRRLADQIDGVDLAAHQVGDVLQVTTHDGDLLIAEEWAIPTTESCRAPVSPVTSVELIHEAADRPREGREQRRAEDRFREELRDLRATVISKKILSKNPV
jgi:hypothetical protein